MDLRPQCCGAPAQSGSCATAADCSLDDVARGQLDKSARAWLGTHGTRAVGRSRAAATNAARRRVDQSALRRHLAVSRR